jgi:TetR/AcrR family transcriptional regulator, tetracycline repressor protein
MPVKLNRDVIAREGLRLLADGGIDGVTMRSLAGALGVRAPTLYWHVRSKRELLDAMADVIAAEAIEHLRPRHPGESVEDWLADMARTFRSAMLRYRDGARVFVGSVTPAAPRATELALTELCRAGFSLEAGAHAVVTLLHYTTGSAIEEQARAGLDYPENPYRSFTPDPTEFPLSATARPLIFNPDADAGFEDGLSVVLAGIRTLGTLKD